MAVVGILKQAKNKVPAVYIYIYIDCINLEMFRLDTTPFAILQNQRGGKDKNMLKLFCWLLTSGQGLE